MLERRDALIAGPVSWLLALCACQVGGGAVRDGDGLGILLEGVSGYGRVELAIVADPAPAPEALVQPLASAIGKALARCGSHDHRQLLGGAELWVSVDGARLAPSAQPDPLLDCVAGGLRGQRLASLETTERLTLRLRERP